MLEAAPSLGTLALHPPRSVVRQVVAGIALGHGSAAPVQALGALNVARVGLPITVPVWLTILPMRGQADLDARAEVDRQCRGIGIAQRSGPWDERGVEPAPVRVDR